MLWLLVLAQRVLGMAALAASAAGLGRLAEQSANAMSAGHYLVVVC